MRPELRSTAYYCPPPPYRWQRTQDIGEDWKPGLKLGCSPTEEEKKDVISTVAESAWELKNAP